MRFRQSSLKKFVLPFLSILILSGASGIDSADSGHFKVFVLVVNLEQVFPQNVGSKKKRRSPDWFFDNAKRMKIKIFTARLRRLLLEKAHDTIRPLYPKGVTIALDITKQSVYSKSKSKYILGGKAEKGTTRAYHFLGACILERQAKYPLGFYLLQKGDIKCLGKIVRDFLREVSDQLTIRHIVLDRGFSWASVVHELQNLDLSYVIGCTRTERVKKIISCLQQLRLASMASFFILPLKTRVEKISETCWIVKNYSFGDPAVATQLVLHKVRVTHTKSKNGKRSW